MSGARRYVSVLYASRDAQVWDFWLFSGHDLAPFVTQLETDLEERGLGRHPESHFSSCRLMNVSYGERQDFYHCEYLETFSDTPDLWDAVMWLLVIRKVDEAAAYAARYKREPFFVRSVPPAARAFARKVQDEYGFQLSRGCVGRHVPQLKVMWEDAHPPP